MNKEATAGPPLTISRYKTLLPDIALHRQGRIEAGLLEIQSRFMLTPGFEWRRYLHEAYDVFAGELSRDREMTSELLEETIPCLVSDVFVECRWQLGMRGTDARDEHHPVRFGSYWVATDHEQFLKRRLLGSVLKWRSTSLFRQAEAGEPKPATPRTQRQSPTEIIDAWMHQEKLRTYNQVIERLGWGRDTFYKLKNQTARVSERVYRDAADLLGCEAADLHPGPAARLDTCRQELGQLRPGLRARSSDFDRADPAD